MQFGIARSKAQRKKEAETEVKMQWILLKKLVKRGKKVPKTDLLKDPEKVSQAKELARKKGEDERTEV